MVYREETNGVGSKCEKYIQIKTKRNSAMHNKEIISHNKEIRNNNENKEIINHNNNKSS